MEELMTKVAIFAAVAIAMLAPAAVPVRAQDCNTCATKSATLAECIACATYYKKQNATQWCRKNWPACH
jgi:hypothetical protein